MINVSDETKQAYISDSIPKTLTVSFPNANITMHNDDIVSESLEIEESINSGTELTFEGCIASQMKFECSAPVRDLRGEKVTISIQAEDTESITLFNGYIDEQSNRTHEDVVTEFTAYDVLYTKGQIDVTDWYNGLTFPITVKNFRDSFFTYIGITQETISLISDGFSIDKVTTKDQILALDIMKAICQVNARFGRIGRDEKFHYTELREITKGLYPSTETYPSDHTYPSKENADTKYEKSDYIKVTYEPFKTSVIDAVYLIAKDGTKTIAGSGSNTLAISDNIIAQGCTDKASMASVILNNIHTIIYTPSTVKAKGYPWLEGGDIYMFNTRKNVVRAYILTRRLTGIQALYDELTAEGSQIREKYQETIETQSSIREADIQGNTAQIGTLRADLIETNTLVASKASITDLNATNARVGSLEADHVSVASLNAVSARVGALEADHVTTDQLNATNAFISSLAAIAITTQNLSAQSISAGQITSGTINADRISTSTFHGRTLQAGGIQLGSASLSVTKMAYISAVDFTNRTATTSYFNVVTW